MGHQSFHRPFYILNRDKGHLHVNLRKLRLAIGAEVFIPKASDDLKIPIKPGDHQNLFEKLWGLGQGVKMTWVEPAWNQIVPGALRSALCKHRGLDL
jgi:hypothetical protein